MIGHSISITATPSSHSLPYTNLNQTDLVSGSLHNLITYYYYHLFGVRGRSRTNNALCSSFILPFGEDQLIESNMMNKFEWFPLR